MDNIIHLITVYVAGGNQPIPASRVAVNALVLAPYDESYYRAKIIGRGRGEEREGVRGRGEEREGVRGRGEEREREGVRGRRSEGRG